jgi:flagellar biosynthesis/type III secretory pathway protein FliH
MYHPKITRIPEYVHFDIRVLSAKEKNTIAGQYIGYSRLAAGLRTKCKDRVECIETLRTECAREGYDVMTQFIEKNQNKMEDAMEMLINSREIFHNYVEGERQDAAEQGREEGREEGRKEGRKEGEKIGEERGKISAVLDLYTAGYIARDVASAQLGVTDQKFEILLKSHS